MTDWTTELAQLLGEVGGAIEAAPGQLVGSAGGVVGHAPDALGAMLHGGGDVIGPPMASIGRMVGMPIRGALDAAVPGYDIHNFTDPIQRPWDLLKPMQQLMAVPTHELQSGVGTAQQLLAQFGHNTGAGQFLTRLVGGDPALQQQIIDAYNQGGGQAAWNAVISTEPVVGQAVLTAGSDPLFWSGIGVTGRLGEALTAASKVASNPVARMAAKAGAGALGTLDTFNDLPGMLVADPARWVVTHGKSLVDTAADAGRGGPIVRGLSWLTSYSPSTKISMQVEDAKNVLQGHLEQTQALAQRGLPARAEPYWHDVQFDDQGNPIEETAGPMWKLFHRPAPGGSNAMTGDVLLNNLSKAQADFKVAADAFRNDPQYQRLSQLMDRGAARVAYAKRVDPLAGKIVDDWVKQGVDPVFSNPVDAAAHLYGQALAKDAGLSKYEQPNLLSIARGVTQQTATLAPAFHVRNIMGAMLLNAVHGFIPSVRDFFGAYQMAQAGIRDPDRVAAVVDQFDSAMALKPFNAHLPAEVLQGGNIARASGPGTDNAVQTAATKLTHNATLGRVLGAPFGWNRRFGQGVETVLRAPAYTDPYVSTMQQALPTIDARLATEFKRPDLSLQRALDHAADNPDGLVLDPGVVREYLTRNYMEPGEAERIARDVAAARNEAHRVGLRSMQALHFSYNKTNLDELIAPYVIFSYWTTRAFPRYLEEGFHHPFLLLDYMRMQQAQEDAQNDPGLDAHSKSMLSLFGSPLGFTVLLDPLALWGVGQLYNFSGGSQDPNEPVTGRVLDFMKQRGFGLYPWIENTLNIMGVYGNSYEADPSSIRQKAIWNAVWNKIRAETGGTPEYFIANASGKVRQSVSTALAHAGAPDWLLHPVAAKDESTTAASMEDFIDNRIITNLQQKLAAQGRTMTQQDLLQPSLFDHDSPEYRQAYNDVANAGLAQAFWNLIGPVSVKIKDAQTDLRMAQEKTITDAADQAGVKPWDYHPTMADVTFAAKYKQLTGKDFTPDDYETVHLANDLATAPDSAKNLIVQDAMYNNLGDPKARDDYGTFLGLLNGDDPRTQGMDDASRRDLANQWLDQQGNAAAVEQVSQLKREYEATHPLLAQYIEWKQAMGELQRQFAEHGIQTLDPYRQEAMRVNPNAAQYFSDLNRQLLATEPDYTARQEQLDQRTTSVKAWLAITGQASSRYQQVPQPLAGSQPPVDQTLAEFNIAPQVPPEPGATFTPPWINALGPPNNRFGH